jgi:hypothetical protein
MWTFQVPNSKSKSCWPSFGSADFFDPTGGAPDFGCAQAGIG